MSRTSTTEGVPINDMVQKIGRFVRQPEAKPFDDPDLNSAYFYFNVSDQQFELLLRDMQAEMTVDGYEVIAVKNAERPKTSRLVEPKFEKTIPSSEKILAMTSSAWMPFFSTTSFLMPRMLQAKAFWKRAFWMWQTQRRRVATHPRKPRQQCFGFHV